MISSRLHSMLSVPWTLWYVRYSVADTRTTMHFLQVANAGVNEIGDYFTPKVKNGKPEKPTMATVNINLLGLIYSKSYPFNYMCVIYPLQLRTWPSTFWNLSGSQMIH